MSSIVPFFVADRPMSLRILKGLPLRDYSDARIGIMAHANTTSNFQTKLKDYPCEHQSACDAIGGDPCIHPDDIEQCPVREHILEHTIKMCDSGIFTREGATLTYKQLFEAYEQMGVKYGIMIDVFQDHQATLTSAKEALKVHKHYKDKFHLVGVAQGQTAEEYFSCYRALKGMGFTHIAVGGLLRRVEKSVRYTQVRDEPLMYQVLDAIRAEYPDDWLFALGCFHPNRLKEFKSRHVWGDYKGWIFAYEKKDDTLNNLLDTLENNDLQHLRPTDHDKLSHILPTLERGIALRDKLMVQREKTSKKLIEERKNVREGITWLYQLMKDPHPNIATLLEPVLTHVLLKDTEVSKVESAVELLDETSQEKGNELLTQIVSTRAFKDRIKELERRISIVNDSIAGAAARVVRQTDVALAHLAFRCQEINQLICVTEREHRFSQVHQHITSRILSQIE